MINLDRCRPKIRRLCELGRNPDYETDNNVDFHCRIFPHRNWNFKWGENTWNSISTKMDSKMTKASKFIYSQNSPRRHWRRNGCRPSCRSFLPSGRRAGLTRLDLCHVWWRIVRSKVSEIQLWFRRDPRWISGRDRLPSCPRNRYCFRFRSGVFPVCMASLLPL